MVKFNTDKVSILVLTVVFALLAFFVGRSPLSSAVAAGNTVPAHHFIGSDNTCKNGNVNENAIGNGEWFAGYCPESTTPASTPNEGNTVLAHHFIGGDNHCEEGYVNENAVGNGEWIAGACPADEGGQVNGCTDPEALNFNEDATNDDGSCRYSEDESPSPQATPDPDVCTNIDGVQLGVPDGMHINATGHECVNFQFGGPQSGGTSGGQVLGASTQGQVLGASTMAKTGSFEENLYMAIMGLGAIITIAGAKNFKKI